MSNINYEELLGMMQSQLSAFVNKVENYDTYKDYKIVLSSEQQFMKLKDKNPNNLYIVVKFGTASILFGQVVVPITLNTLSEQNKLIIAQKLMTDFAEEYNLQRNSDRTIQQIWKTPSVSGNFSAVYEGWRSIIITQGVLVVTKQAEYYDVFVSFVDGNNSVATQQVPTIATTFALVNNPDSQPFYNSNDFTRTENTFGSVTLNMVMMLIDNNFIVNKFIDIMCGSTTDLIFNPSSGKWETDIEKSNIGSIIKSWSSKINDSFALEIKFSSGRSRKSNMKIVNAQVGEKIGEIPTINITFTE